MNWDKNAVLLDVCRDAHAQEFNDLMNELHFSDLSSIEVLTILSALRSAHERRQAAERPLAQVKVLEPGGHRKRGAR